MKLYGIILSFFALCLAGAASAEETSGNGIVSVSVSEDGRLTALSNLSTGQNYASGEYLWRMYYDSPDRKEIEIGGAGQKAETSLRDGTIEVYYPELVSEDGSTLDISLTLRIRPDGRLIRFASEISNNEAHVVVREFQYPLIGNIDLPEDHDLITAETGGMRYDDPVGTIYAKSNSKPYMTPAQYFRQMDMKYPSGVSMNCFILAGDTQGLYFGSHDNLLRYILQTHRNLKLGLISVVHRLKQPKAKRYDDEKQKNQKFPTLCTEQETSDFS